MPAVAFVLPVAWGGGLAQPVRAPARWLMNAAIYLAMAAFVSLLVFRIFQPYAFGPGFWDTPQPAVGLQYQGTAQSGGG
jgi:hypothetical protein